MTPSCNDSSQGGRSLNGASGIHTPSLAQRTRRQVRLLTGEGLKTHRGKSGRMNQGQESTDLGEQGGLRLKGSWHQGQRWAQQLWWPEKANFNLPEAHSFCTRDISDKQVLHADATEQLAVTVSPLALLPPPLDPHSHRESALCLGEDSDPAGWLSKYWCAASRTWEGKEGGRSLRNDQTG